MTKASISHEPILAQLQASPAAKVKVAVVDIDGILRGKYMQKEKFLASVTEGFGFCNVVFGWDCADVCYDNTTYTGWHTGYPDAQAHVDMRSFRKIPYEQGQPFFLADFRDAQAKPLPVCPRQLLKRVVQRGADMGLFAQVGMEFEWFNFRETPQGMLDKAFRDPAPISPGMCGYSLLRLGQQQPFVDALFADLTALDIPLESLHTETGPGVYEAALRYGDALDTADRAVIFKHAVKQIAHRFGIMSSFMAKWHADLPGSGGHMHQSLTNREGEPVFFDNSASARGHMSKTFEAYVAGQIHCLPYILPFFAPNVNSYKRLVQGTWAPTRVTWGIDNRTTSLRVVTGSSRSTRLETRVGGSDINPYLALAASLASGLYGIERKLSLSAVPVKGSAYQVQDAVPLATSLKQAVDVMAASPIAKELFGEVFVEHFAQTRVWEWRQSQLAVTDWEVKRYFENI